jgi:hypothetical protein
VAGAGIEVTVTPSRTVRHRRAGSSGGEAVRVDAVADEVTAHLIALPLDYRDTIDSITALLTAEPRNAGNVRAVVTAIVATALGDPFREISANQWRPALPTWVRPPMIGATVRQLVNAGLLVTTGRYVRSTDTRGGNTNKFCPIYTLNLAALVPTEPDAVDTSAASRGA